MDAVNRNSSLFYHLLLLCVAGCCGVWFVITLAMLVYKGVLLRFPRSALPMEIVFVILVSAIEAAGVLLGTRGNLADDAIAIVIATSLLLLAAVGALYFMWLQTYVMALDVGFSATLLGFNVLAVLTGAVCVARILWVRQKQRRRFVESMHAKAQ